MLIVGQQSRRQRAILMPISDEALYCSVDQYKARYEDEVDDADLKEILSDACALIRDELVRSGLPADGVDGADTRMRIARTVAHRMVAQLDDVPEGVSQFSMGTGEFTRSISVPNPYGEAYLTASERERLGIGASRACFASCC